MKKTIYTVSIRFARKDGKPISKRSKFHKECVKLRDALVNAGFEDISDKPEAK